MNTTVTQYNFCKQKLWNYFISSILCIAPISILFSQNLKDIDLAEYNYIITDNQGKYIELGNCDIDKKDGKWMYFYQDGSIKEIGHYSSDVKTGKWTYYLISGEKYAKGKYFYGRKHKKWTYINGCSIKYNLGNIIKEKCKDLQAIY